MTDNRTTEHLRALLEEHGLSCQTHYLHVSWCVGQKLYGAVDNLDGTLTVGRLTPEQAIAATVGEKPRGRTEEWLLNACNRATQDYVAQLEQEVGELKSKLEAATLGNDDDYERKMDELLCRLTNGKWSKSRAYSVEFMVSCIDEEFEALYNEEQFSAPVHGTLTAEQVRKAIRKYAQDDSCYIFEVYGEMCGPIADELNAELGSGTCEIECFDDGVDEGLDGEWFSYAPPTWYLSCGHTVQGMEGPNFCPSCGARVIKENE